MTTMREWRSAFQEELNIHLAQDDSQLECFECEEQWPKTGDLFVSVVVGICCPTCFGVTEVVE